MGKYMTFQFRVSFEEWETIKRVAQLEAGERGASHWARSVLLRECAKRDKKRKGKR